jgi:hypothetical protein
MSVTSEFYRDRATECTQEAEAATLDNVRSRCLRSASAWQAMADRLARAEALRDRQAAAKTSEAVMGTPEAVA